MLHILLIIAAVIGFILFLPITLPAALIAWATTLTFWQSVAVVLALLIIGEVVKA